MEWSTSAAAGNLAEPLARDALAAACFLLFVAGAWWAGSRPSRRRVSILAAGVMVVTFGVAAANRDLYPFTRWDLVGFLAPDSIHIGKLTARDAAGIEHDLDYRFARPLSLDELHGWLGRNFASRDSSGRAAAAAWLLERANASAAAVRAGDRLARGGLGRLSAPYFALHPARWSRAHQAPDSLVELLYYRDEWDLERRSSSPRDWRRVLLYRYPAR